MVTGTDGAGSGAGRRRLVRLLVLSYLLLLGASHVVRAARDANDVELAAGERRIELPTAVEGRTSPPSPIVWRERSGAEASDPPVLLLHGSPGRRTDLADLAAALAAEGRRVLSPDLPGFGDSPAAPPDVSIRTHAHAALALLEALGIERAHVVGYSMGGGVALEMCERSPERIASLTLLSAIGVQELELFGSYHLNHAIHGLQLGLLLALHEGVPHFGLLDRSILSVAYARNFFDSDQRPLRAALGRWEGPTLVVHGRSDSLVPLEAALESHRLVPQSELALLDGGHMLVFTRGDELAARISPFLARVDGGRALVRADASPARAAEAAVAFDPAELPAWRGIALLVVCLLAAVATLVSEDLACIAMGTLVAQGRISLLAGAAACFAGIFVGDMLLFLAGRTLGRGALGRAPLRWFLSAERVERASAWFRKRGAIVVLTSRFTPGARLPTYFAAGLLRTSFLRFASWFAIAAALWTPTLVWLSSRLGSQLQGRIEMLQRHFLLGLVVCVLAGLTLLKLVLPALTWRGRRLLVSRWRRFVRWEYWPRSVFYAPLVLWILWLGLRMRRATAFTAVNPGMPASGVVGESKHAILSRLERVPPTRILVADGGGRVQDEHARSALAQFRSEHALGWPVVVKPDVGQRGDGVAIVRCEQEALEAVRAIRGDVILQAHVPGVEYGLFYVRKPWEPGGWIFSAVEKRLLSVRGDGASSLERLILSDRRAVDMAPYFLERHAARLDDVPPEGEEFLLGELGTHCRGALFLDGRAVVGEPLERELDRVAKGYPGFYFGRFDVRAESARALAEGRFQILELNGVTSEAAHVYDPSGSLLDAWRTLGRQWALAFEIGAHNAGQGAPVTGVLGLLRLVSGYARHAAGAPAVSGETTVGHDGDSTTNAPGEPRVAMDRRSKGGTPCAR